MGEEKDKLNIHSMLVSMEEIKYRRNRMCYNLGILFPFFFRGAVILNGKISTSLSEKAMVEPT